jgi:hypothetical protein
MVYMEEWRKIIITTTTIVDGKKKLVIFKAEIGK